MTEAHESRIRQLPPYAKVPDASEMLGVGVAPLRDHIRAGTIRAVRIGGRVVVDLGQAVRFLDTLPQADLAVQSRCSEDA